MREVAITPKMKAEAEKRSQAYFDLYEDNGGTLLDSKRVRKTGYLAEVAIKAAYPFLEYSDSMDVDFRYGALRFDSKAKGCNKNPQGYYSADLFEAQVDRETDYYIFSFVHNSGEKAWVGGVIRKEQYLKAAEYKPAGTVGRNFVYDHARYELPIKQLVDPDLFFGYIEQMGKERFYPFDRSGVEYRLCDCGGKAYLRWWPHPQDHTSLEWICQKCKRVLEYERHPGEK